MHTASWGRRVLAIVIDWFTSILVVMAIMGPAGWSENPYSSFYNLAVFLLESIVLTATLGGSFGKLVTRLRVVRYDGTGQLNLLQSLIRTALVCLVIPPLVFRPDGRGLHDLAAGSMTVPLAELQGRSSG